MNNTLILDKTIEDWTDEFPILNNIINANEVFWINNDLKKLNKISKKLKITEEDIKDAKERLKRFSSYIQTVFPETINSNGIIESKLLKIDNMKKEIEKFYSNSFDGSFYVKLDSHLPISGSIKARGGIYEVLKHAESLAIKNGLLSINDDYSKLANEKFKTFFSNYSIAVGSTGNLGLSIGIISAKLGFNVYVHMSKDAKEWKKNLLREKGVTVIEYSSDYSKAVKEGRRQAEKDPNMHFIDDENSIDLFLGYAVAAFRLKNQLKDMNIMVDKSHPLFIYLPCGVGGAPGGIAYGLKLIFKDNIHCFFAEPTHSPCMLLGLLTKKHDKISVNDFGLDNITKADGLAVGRASGFVGKNIENLISGVYTVDDDSLFKMLSLLYDSENVFLEPSALAGILGLNKLYRDGQDYIEKNNLKNLMKNSTHIAWATGGNMVPENIKNEYYNYGKNLK